MPSQLNTDIFQRLFIGHDGDNWDAVFPTEICRHDPDEHRCPRRRIINGAETWSYGQHCSNEGLLPSLPLHHLAACVELPSYQLVFEDEQAITAFLDSFSTHYPQLAKYITTVRRHRNNLILTAQELRDLQAPATKLPAPLWKTSRIRHRRLTIRSRMRWIEEFLDQRRIGDRQDPSLKKLVYTSPIKEYDHTAWTRLNIALEYAADVINFWDGAPHSLDSCTHESARALRLTEGTLIRDRRGVVVIADGLRASKIKRGTQTVPLNFPLVFKSWTPRQLKPMQVPLDVAAAAA